MARGGGHGAKPGRKPPRKGAAGTPRKPVGPAPRKPASSPAPPAPPLPAGPFRLGAIPGATPGKWIDTWTQRMPRIRLELVPLEVATQDEGIGVDVDAAIVRLPVRRDDLHTIALYDEQPVVVCAADSHLTAADELRTDDLAGELLIVPDDDVLDPRVPGTETPRFPPLRTTGDAIATVASGVGIVIVPMSLARLHQRKDVAVRPLVDGPVSAVALAWPASDASPLVDTFIGIVRGRTANSSRG